MRVVFVNGRFVPESEAVVSIFDRGFTMGDGVYEVTSVMQGRMLEFDAHMARLMRSLNEVGMVLDTSATRLKEIHEELISLNKLDDGLVYLQVTRGVQDRNFLFPSTDTPLTLVLFTQDQYSQRDVVVPGFSVMTVPDLRWGRCDVKSTQLLYACMAKNLAQREGYQDAWFVRDGLVTEAASSNVFIVTKDKVVVTRELSTALLPGVLRARILDFIRASGLRLEERAFSVDEAKAAAEAFITNSVQFVYPVVAIDGVTISGGIPGEFTLALRKAYIESALKQTGEPAN